LIELFRIFWMRSVALMVFQFFRHIIHLDAVFSFSCFLSFCVSVLVLTRAAQVQQALKVLSPVPRYALLIPFPSLSHSHSPILSPRLAILARRIRLFDWW